MCVKFVFIYIIGYFSLNFSFFLIRVYDIHQIRYLHYTMRPYILNFFAGILTALYPLGRRNNNATKPYQKGAT